MDIWEFLFYFFFAYISFYINKVRIAYFGSPKPLNRKTLLVVFGSGGHTSEMLFVLKTLDFSAYRKVTFVVGHSDKWSPTKIRDYYHRERGINIDMVGNLEVATIYRAREVGQSYVSSVFTTLFGIANAFTIVIKSKPDLVCHKMHAYLGLGCFKWPWYCSPNMFHAIWNKQSYIGQLECEDSVH